MKNATDSSLREHENNNGSDTKNARADRSSFPAQESIQNRPKSVEEKDNGVAGLTVLKSVGNYGDLNTVAASDPCRKRKQAPHSGSALVHSSANNSYRRFLTPKASSVSGTAKDPLTVWKEMKENGFLSSSHAGLTFHGAGTSSSHGVIPAQTKIAARSKPTRKKKETPKKDNTRRIGKASTPTGLLSGLNLGIINNVRNKRQVHSIINSLVRSQTIDNKSDKTKLDDDAKIPATDFESDPTENGAVSLLSLKAANTASQWLDLLNQDINGRLSALKRTRKRVGLVLTTELPLLISSEQCSSKGDHHARWGKTFNQIGIALEEEEKHLERWLHNVRDLQVHCDNALQTSQLGCPPKRKEKTESAIRVAAASIYSTCNFIMTKEK